MTAQTGDERITERRVLKATLLADALEAAGIDKADLLLDLPAGVWALATKVVCRTTPYRIGPPSTTTQALCFVEMKRREQARMSGGHVRERDRAEGSSWSSSSPPRPPQPEQNPECANPECGRSIFGDPLYCELHRPRKPHVHRGPSGYGSVEPGASEWARWISEGRDMHDE